MAGENHPNWKGGVTLTKEKLNKHHREVYKKTESYRFKHRISQSKRKALKVSTDDGTVTPEFIKDLLQEQKYLCKICECDISKNYHIDHIKPLSLKGEHASTNIQILCPTCNIQKSNNY